MLFRCVQRSYKVLLTYLRNGHISREWWSLSLWVSSTSSQLKKKAIQNFEKRIKEIGKWRLSDFTAILEQANLPVTYRAFKAELLWPTLPGLLRIRVSHQCSWQRLSSVKGVTVELAFESKDEDLGERLERLWTTTSSFSMFKKKHLSETERLYVKS